MRIDSPYRNVVEGTFGRTAPRPPYPRVTQGRTNPPVAKYRHTSRTESGRTTGRRLGTFLRRPSTCLTRLTPYREDVLGCVDRSVLYDVGKVQVSASTTRGSRIRPVSFCYILVRDWKSSDGRLLVSVFSLCVTDSTRVWKEPISYPSPG